MGAHFIRAFAFLFFLASSLSSPARAFDDGTTPFVVSPPIVVDRMLRLAGPRPGELLIDLGSGDGRIVIEAAKRYGARGLGVDIDPRLVQLAQDNARRAGVESLARFDVQDLFQADLRGAAVVTMYLLPDVNKQLVPKLLAELKPGARIVSHDYDLGGWPPDESVELRVPEKMVGPLGRSRVFLWLVPADARGAWASELPQYGGRWEFRIAQTFQQLEVQALVEGRALPVRAAEMRGEEVFISAPGAVGGRTANHLFRGTLKEGRILGELLISYGGESRTIPWQARRIP